MKILKMVSMFIKVNQRSSKTIIFILPLPMLGWYAHFISITRDKDQAQNTTQYKTNTGQNQCWLVIFFLKK
jgi:hypothetical protein